MARSTYNVQHKYIGNGSTASYTFNFKIEALTQLLVLVFDDSDVEIQRVRGDDTTYLDSVTFPLSNTSDAGGTVVLQSNLQSGYTIIILLANDEPTQPYEFRNKGSFSLRLFEKALDFILGPTQRLQYMAARSLRLNEFNDETAINTILPVITTSNRGYCLSVSDDGTTIELTDRVTPAEMAQAISDAVDNSSPLPVGGVEGAVLTKQSATDLDADWEAFAFSGYSGRFNEAFDTTNLQATLAQIINLSYLAPQVSLTASGSGTVREKGNAVTASTLTAAVTKRSDNIARIQFKLDGVSIDDNNPPANTGSGNTVYNWTGSFSDNSTFSVEVTDDGATGGPSTITSSRNFTFVYPYYYGVGAVGLTAAQVAALTKDIRTESTNLNRNFGVTSGEVYYFAYPAAYGALSSILDENGFETVGDWTQRTENITGLDATAQSYYIYEFNNVVSAPATNYTFIQ